MGKIEHLETRSQFVPVSLEAAGRSVVLNMICQIRWADVLVLLLVLIKVYLMFPVTDLQGGHDLENDQISLWNK